jgi:hypothetical protein
MSRELDLNEIEVQTFQEAYQRLLGATHLSVTLPIAITPAEKSASFYRTKGSAESALNAELQRAIKSAVAVYRKRKYSDMCNVDKEAYAEQAGFAACLYESTHNLRVSDKVAVSDILQLLKNNAVSRTSQMRRTMRIIRREPILARWTAAHACHTDRDAQARRVRFSDPAVIQ